MYLYFQLEVDTLIKTNEMLKNQLADKEQIERENEHLFQNLQQVQEESQALKHQRFTTKVATDEFKLKFRVMETENDFLKKAVVSLERHVKDQRQKMEKQQVSLEAKELERVKLEKKMYDLAEPNDRIEEIKFIQKEMFISASNCSKKQIAQLKNTVAVKERAFDRIIRDLTKTIYDLKQDKHLLEAQVEDHNQKLKQLRSEFEVKGKELQNKIEELFNENYFLNRDKLLLEAQVVKDEGSKKKIEDLIMKNLDIKTEKLRLAERLESSQKPISQLKVALTWKLKNSRKKMDEDQIQNEQAINKLRQGLEDSGAKASVLSAENEELEKVNEINGQEMAKKDQENSQFCQE